MRMLRRQDFGDVQCFVDSIDADSFVLTDPSLFAMRHSDNTPVDYLLLDDAAIVWTGMWIFVC